MQEQPCHVDGVRVLFAPVLGNGLVVRDCDADATEGAERGENLMEARSPMSIKARESVLMMVSSMTGLDEQPSLL